MYVFFLSIVLLLGGSVGKPVWAVGEEGLSLKQGEEARREGGGHPQVTLQVLDKITGRTQVIEVKNQDPVGIGSLRLRVYRCHKASLEEMPESVAYLYIWEEKTGQPPKELFNGWMFSSSPAVSALEHPVYDVRVLECHQCTTCCAS